LWDTPRIDQERKRNENEIQAQKQNKRNSKKKKYSRANMEVWRVDLGDEDDFAPPMPSKKRKSTQEEEVPEKLKPTTAQSRGEIAPLASSSPAGGGLPAVATAKREGPTGASLETRVEVLEKTVAQLREDKAALKKQVDALLAAKTQQDARLAKLELALASEGKKGLPSTKRTIKDEQQEVAAPLSHVDEGDDAELAALLWLEEQAAHEADLRVRV
jgi:hypothetical protein